jgi:hypothetical protein
MICWQYSPMRQPGACAGNRNSPKLTHGATRRLNVRMKTNYSSVSSKCIDQWKLSLRCFFYTKPAHARSARHDVVKELMAIDRLPYWMREECRLMQMQTYAAPSIGRGRRLREKASKPLPSPPPWTSESGSPHWGCQAIRPRLRDSVTRRRACRRPTRRRPAKTRV